MKVLACLGPTPIVTGLFVVLLEVVPYHVALSGGSREHGVRPDKRGEPSQDVTLKAECAADWLARRHVYVYSFEEIHKELIVVEMGSILAGSLTRTLVRISSLTLRDTMRMIMPENKISRRKHPR
jgi:hypothetical protein